MERLIASAERDRVSLESLDEAIRGFDLKESSVETSHEIVAAKLIAHGCTRAVELAHAWVRQGDFLLRDDLLSDELLEADYIVGNPPYIC